jgi:hypothetical protein
MPDRHRATADPPEDPPVLIVATLSRLTRDTRFLLTLLDGNVEVVFADLPQLPPGAMGSFFLIQNGGGHARRMDDMRLDPASMGFLVLIRRDAPVNVLFFDELRRHGFIEAQNLTVEWRAYAQPRQQSGRRPSRTGNQVRVGDQPQDR